MSTLCQQLVLSHMSRDDQEPTPEQIAKSPPQSGGWQTQCFKPGDNGGYNPKPPGEGDSEGCATEFTRLSACCVLPGNTASHSCKQSAIEKCGTADAITSKDECPIEKIE